MAVILPVFLDIHGAIDLKLSENSAMTVKIPPPPPRKQLQRTGAALNRGRSKQDYATPRNFLNAVEGRFGKLSVDLACDDSNKVAPVGLTKEVNSLSFDWNLLAGNAWLNPPFGKIAPWAEKCYGWQSSARPTFFLVPASVGSNWFADWVFNKSLVLFLSPRLTFVGQKDPFPKDLMLCCYGLGQVGFECWRWRQDHKTQPPPIKLFP